MKTPYQAAMKLLDAWPDIVHECRETLGSELFYQAVHDFVCRVSPSSIGRFSKAATWHERQDIAEENSVGFLYYSPDVEFNSVQRHLTTASTGPLASLAARDT